MNEVHVTFKLVSTGIDGFDLLLTRLDGFSSGLEERRGVPSLPAAIEVVQRVLGRQLTAGEQTTLAIGNGLAVAVNSANIDTYF